MTGRTEHEGSGGGPELPPAAGRVLARRRAAARTELARTLRGMELRQSVIDDAVVVVSELVTNAVRHGTPRPDGQVGVEWAVDARQLRLRVTDGGRRRVAGSAHQVEAVGGRGLAIVAALADAWDFERHDAGTTVTAVFDLV